MDFIKSYSSIGIAVATVIVSLIAQWAVFSVRLSNIESRMDRQGTAISTLQESDKSQIATAASLEAKVDAIADNVNYIRSRVDSFTR